MGQEVKMNFDYLRNLAFLTADGGGGGDNPQFGNDETITLTPKELQSKIDSAISKAVEKNTQKHQATIADLQRQIEELSVYKQKYQEYEFSKLTEEEKIKRMQADLESKLKEADKRLNRAVVKNMFVENGLKGDEIDELLDIIVTDDAKASVEAAKKHINLLKKTAENIAKAQYDEALQKMPKPPSTDGAKILPSLEDFRKMSFKEQLKFKEENPDLWKQFSQQLITFQFPQEKTSLIPPNKQK